jgi:preprotein translocase subunit SecG
MIAVLTAFHVLVCVGLIIVVLLQTGRGTGMASVFGGGGGGSLMGGKGFGGILAKATAGLAITFMLLSITLSLIPRGGVSTAPDRQSQEQGRATQTEQPVQGQPPPEGSMPDDFPVEETPPASEEAPPADQSPGETPAGG